VAEFGAPLAPGDDFIAVKKRGGFFDELFFAGEIAIGDFAVVEDSLDFLGIGGNADGEAGERAAPGMAGDFLAGKICGAESRAGIARNGLHVDAVKGSAVFERADQQDVLKNAAAEAERAGAGAFLKPGGKLEDNFLEIILGAAGEIRAQGFGEDEIAGGEAEFAVKGRRKDSEAVRTSREVASIEGGKAIGTPVEKFAEAREIFGVAVLAEPLQLVFVAAGTKADEFGHAGIEPAEGIGKLQRMQGFDFIAVPEGDEARLGVCALVEGKDEGAIEAGSVVSAGSVAEMMIEMRGARTAAEEMMELILDGSRFRTLGALGSPGGTRIPGKPLRDGDGAAVRKLETVFGEAAREGQARDVERIVKTIELFLFDGEKDGGFIEERYRGTAADGGDAEKVHRSPLRRLP